MAEAESAHTTDAPASSFGARVTYHDLNRSDGSINRSALMTLAVRRAQHERAACQRVGYGQPWRKYLSEALRCVWEIAKNSAMPGWPLAPPRSSWTGLPPFAASSHCFRTARITARPSSVGGRSRPN
jgi:hypothetical protein